LPNAETRQTIDFFAIESSGEGLMTNFIGGKAVVVFDSMNGRIDRNTEQALQRFMALASQHYRTRGAILYGSRARGDHDPDSDADLLVLLEGEHQRFVTTKLAMTDLAYDVLLETGLYISPL
jgi:predicted nucleotidyltransferase